MGLFVTTNRCSDFNKVRETEKAIGLNAWANKIYMNGREGKSWEMIVWIPKSIIKDDIIPDWFLNKKSSDYEIDGLNVVPELAN